jgi:hypothetical protein
MRTAPRRLHATPQHPNRQAHAEQQLPALQRTSRYRFHEDESERFPDSLRTLRYHARERDAEDES